jgi:hypothetical protein
MNPKKVHFFEIARRGNSRFYWLFVSFNLRSRRRRVLARSTRDYRSPEKTEEAIVRLVGTTYVLDTTGGPFELPTTSFQTVPGVVPLTVDEFPVEDFEGEFHVLGAALARSRDVPAAKPKASRSRRKPAKRRATRAAA